MTAPVPTPNQMPGAQPTPTPPADPTPPPAPPAAEQQPAAAPPADAPKPPWGSDEEFDPQRAWSLIQNLRGELADHKKTTDPIVQEHERLRRASMEDNERLTEDLTNTAAREAAWRNRAVTAEARTLATDKFINADDALAFVGDLSGYLDGDSIDTTKLQQRLDQLAADKPYLVKQAPPQGFTPNRGQGQSGAGAPPSIDAQIEAAQKSGNTALSIALKQQKYYQSKT